MGLEGLISKRRDRAYRGGRCNHWIKIKNPDSPRDEAGSRSALDAVIGAGAPARLPTHTVGLIFGNKPIRSILKA
jgi:ATP-dependent DNA ligase